MFDIFVIFFVLNELRSIEFNSPQNANMLDISVTSLVSNNEENLIELNLEQIENILLIDFTLDVLNEDKSSFSKATFS